MSYFKNMPRVYLLDIETGIQEVVGNFLDDFAPRFSPDGKNHYEFCKDGNSDIYSMDMETRVVERVRSFCDDTSTSYSPDGKYICLILIEADSNKYIQ